MRSRKKKFFLQFARLDDYYRVRRGGECENDKREKNAYRPQPTGLFYVYSILLTIHEAAFTSYVKICKIDDDARPQSFSLFLLFFFCIADEYNVLLFLTHKKYSIRVYVKAQIKTNNTPNENVSKLLGFYVTYIYVHIISGVAGLTSYTSSLGMSSNRNEKQLYVLRQEKDVRI